MRRSLTKMAEEFKLHWRAYVVQSLVAAVVVFVLMLFLQARHLVLTASLGSTAFVVFAMPRSLTAQPRNVVGGHVLSLACGALCAVVAASVPGLKPAVFAASVGLSAFVMVVTDTEHPPAAGTALGVATAVWGGYMWKVVLAVVLGAVLMSLTHHLFKPYLRDLV